MTQVVSPFSGDSSLLERTPRLIMGRVYSSWVSVMTETVSGQVPVLLQLVAWGRAAVRHLRGASAPLRSRDLTVSGSPDRRGSRIFSQFGHRHDYFIHPEARNVPFFFRYEKNTLELPISARPPKKRSPPEKRSTKSPSSIQRKAGIVTFFFFFLCTCLRIFALVLRIFAFVLHFDFCSLLSKISATDYLGGPTSPILGKHSK